MARVVTLTICPPIDSQCPCFRVARPTTTTADPGPRLGKCRSADVADCGNLLIMSAQVPAVGYEDEALGHHRIKHADQGFCIGGGQGLAQDDGAKVACGQAGSAWRGFVAHPACPVGPALPDLG